MMDVGVFWLVHIRYKCLLSLFQYISYCLKAAFIWNYLLFTLIHYMCVYSLLGCYKRHLPHSWRFILNLFLNLLLFLSLWSHIHPSDSSRTLSAFFVLFFLTHECLTVIFCFHFLLDTNRYHNCPTDT